MFGAGFLLVRGDLVGSAEASDPQLPIPPSGGERGKGTRERKVGGELFPQAAGEGVWRQPSCFFNEQPGR